MSIVHVHDRETAQHAHAEGTAHDHSTAMNSMSNDDPIADSNSKPMDHHKAAGGQCCGMMCVTALPATLIDFVRPDSPQSMFVSTGYRVVSDNAPARLYRPPIT